MQIIHSIIYTCHIHNQSMTRYNCVCYYAPRTKTNVVFLPNFTISVYWFIVYSSVLSNSNNNEMNWNNHLNNLAMFRNCSQKVCNIYCGHLNSCIYLLGSGLYISCYNFLPNPLCFLRNKLQSWTFSNNEFIHFI